MLKASGGTSRRLIRRDRILQKVQRRRLLIPEVPKQDFAELPPVSTAERIQNALMFAHRLGPTVALARKIGGIAHPADLAGEAGIGGRKRRISGRGYNVLMDQLVTMEITVHIALEIGAVHLVMQSLDL